MDALNAVTPTFTVHPLVLGAPVKIVPVAAAAAAFLGISAHPAGGVLDGKLHPTVASVPFAAGLPPVVTDSTPEIVVPLMLELPLPAAAPLETLGAPPEPVNCCA